MGLMCGVANMMGREHLVALETRVSNEKDAVLAHGVDDNAVEALCSAGVFFSITIMVYGLSP